MRLASTLAVPAVTLALLAAGCGDDDTETSDDGVRTVDIDMVDIGFEPDTVEVASGETVRLVFSNTGEVAHDAFVGDADAQTDHEMDMEMGHETDEENAITVEPGDTGQLTYTFEEPGTIEIGCHQPGHYDAGMKIDVTVA